MEHLRKVFSPHQFGVLLYFFGVDHVFFITTDGTRKSPEFQLYVLEQHDHRTGWFGNSANAKLTRLCFDRNTRRENRKYWTFAWITLCTFALWLFWFLWLSTGLGNSPKWSSNATYTSATLSIWLHGVCMVLQSLWYYIWYSKGQGKLGWRHTSTSVAKMYQNLIAFIGKFKFKCTVSRKPKMMK